MIKKRRAPLYLIVAFLSGILLSHHPVLADQNQNQKTKLQSASELDYPPFATVRSDGTADGFSVDLLKAVVDVAGLEVNIPVGPWSEIFQQLNEGRLDVLPLVAYSPERDKVLDFTAPYLQMHGTIFVRKGETSIRTEADLKDKEVLVMRDDSSHEYALSSKIPAKLILTTSFEEAMKLLSSGKHDAVLCQYLMGLQLIKKLGIKNIVSVSSIEYERGLKPRTIKLLGFEQKFCFAVPEGRKELLAKLNEGLAIVVANGKYDQLYEKWFGPILPEPTVSLITTIKNALYIVIPFLFILAIAGIWYLRREVFRKTQSLRIEIGERKLAEEQIKASLKEKEILLHEIHHRVKNNMQVISSLLDLQANSINDTNIKEALKESQSRVHTMAAVHETLHDLDNLSEIDLQTYLAKVTSAIFQTYSIKPDKISLINDIEPLPISINQASPLGLVINELISNALKYAFPDDRKGEITVTMKKVENELELTVMDDGVGFPENVDWLNSNSLGLKLVRSLAEDQLGGSVDMERNNGTKFTIKFNIET